MQDAILHLKAMGQMPSDYEDMADSVPDAYGELLKQIKTPITMQEAEILAGLFPETGLFGLEWTLLHIFETARESGTADTVRYKNAVLLCKSEEWQETLLRRLETHGK